MRVPIQYKIAGIITIVVVLVLSGVYVSLEHTLRQETLQRVDSRLQRDIAFVRTFLEHQDSSSFRSSDELADQIGRDLQVRVTIMDLEGVVHGDSGVATENIGQVENHLSRPEVQQARRLPVGESTRFSTTVRKDMLYVATRYGRPRPQGFLRLALPVADITESIQNLRRIMLTGILVNLVLSVVIGLAASFFISRPIREISAAARRIADGDFSPNVRISSNDEIQDLAEAINYMSVQTKARMAEVTDSLSRFEAVLFSMFEGVMVVDAKGEVLLMNQSLRELLRLGMTPQGRKPLEVIRNIGIQELTTQALNCQEGVVSRELSLLLPEERIVLVHGTPVRQGDRTEGAVLVFHDITELRRLEKIRSDFVANVSHELRTPISTIKGYAETLLDGALSDPGTAAEFVKIIHTDADLLAKLVDDLLDLARIESGNVPLALRSVRLQSVVRRVVQALDPGARSHDVWLKMDLPDDLPAVSADETALAQVLLNLIENAIKYNQPDGEVLIQAHAGKEMVVVEVRDTGIGIPPGDLDRIFERFYRVDKAHSRKVGGTGLGLSIVKHLIHAHGGELSVESLPGQGSTFRFTLPKA